MLSHQKLKVYGKSLSVVASLATHSGHCDKRRAVVDHLCRRPESMWLYCAQGVRGYGGPPSSEPQEGYFAHEPLEVYQISLGFMRWFNGLPAGAELASRLCRQNDKAATSLILNLAEGYGRTGEGDRLRFLATAESAAVRASAYLDLCVSKAELEAGEQEPGVELLSL